jgi:hypothetical protein
MSRRNQTRRRRTYGRRQHEVRERRDPETPTETDALTSEDTWGDWTTRDVGDDQHPRDGGSYGSYAR